jgi:hypothetical protein
MKLTPLIARWLILRISALQKQMKEWLALFHGHFYVYQVIKVNPTL